MFDILRTHKKRKVDNYDIWIWWGMGSYYAVRQRGYFGDFTKWVGPQTAFTLCNSAAKHLKIFKVKDLWLFSHLKHLTCAALRLLAIITTKTRLWYQSSLCQATLFNNFIHLLVLFCRNKIKGGSFTLVTVALRVKTVESATKHRYTERKIRPKKGFREGRERERRYIASRVFHAYFTHFSHACKLFLKSKI